MKAAPCSFAGTISGIWRLPPLASWARFQRKIAS
jgi:hypothetical protein